MSNHHVHQLMQALDTGPAVLVSVEGVQGSGPREAGAWMAVRAPASTPNDIVQRMNQEINTVLAMPEVKEKLYAQYMEPIGGSVQDLQNFMQQELRVMSPVIKRTGLRMD